MVKGHSKVARRGECPLNLDDALRFPDIGSIPVASPDPEET
jgi:hypothetical protein